MRYFKQINSTLAPLIADIQQSQKQFEPGPFSLDRVSEGARTENY
jgi:hypothetical protein